ncbi:MULTISPECIES: Lrp/AsnC family transcriptional regulator [Photobacterium]|jgi:Lrp/AsnC family transcriptional regulator, leucine-responsive regulatory protein|uniref:Leucine-responsive regulatory protein n=2 Tax=Photobacterium TaxID=657 RepID=A0A2T3JJN9_9GAMM|nr:MULTISPECIES: Lrp/AsnC family transcriptional regulator [Photobacterium]PSU49199.1 AsnC family transcriptional regulator [Photobacterium frigidiphilum]PSV45232.1 AsnC family transcriptional regulator [Photobacterium indicum]
MDRFDERILRELKLNGRLTNVELADRIGLSPSATLRRVQELERNGVIKGYRAVLDRNKLGLCFVAYVTVGLSNHSKQAQLEFEERINDATEVTECHNITGVSEYLLKVETKDLIAYKRFHADVLGEIPQVNSIATMVVMESPKEAG